MPSDPTIKKVPIRTIILALIVMATSIDYITRVNINIAIVTMVKQNTSADDIRGDVCPLSGYHEKHHNKSSSTPSSPSASQVDEDDVNRFAWSPTTQGVILGSFWYTYMMMQVPSGRMAEMFGGKMIVAISLIGSGVINIVTPFVSPYLSMLVITRMILGVVQGGIFPSCYAMIGKWFPLKERSLGFAFMEIGATVGSVIATTSAGYLSEHFSWPSVFYLSGLISLLSFVAWYSLTESSPLKYAGITNDELNYIQSGEYDNEFKEGTSSSSEAPAATSSSCDETSVEKTVSIRVPWSKIFTSAPVLAIITSKFCLSVCFFTLLTKLPAYLHDVLHVSPTEVRVLLLLLDHLIKTNDILVSPHVSHVSLVPASSTRNIALIR